MLLQIAMSGNTQNYTQDYASYEQAARIASLENQLAQQQEELQEQQRGKGRWDC